MIPAGPLLCHWGRGVVLGRREPSRKSTHRVCIGDWVRVMKFDAKACFVNTVRTDVI